MLYKPGDSSSCPRTCVGEREDKLLQINFLIATLWSADGCVFHSLSHTLKHTRRHTYAHTHTDRQTRTDRIEENQSIGVSDLRLRLVLARTACVCVSHQLRTISACFRVWGEEIWRWYFAAHGNCIRSQLSTCGLAWLLQLPGAPNPSMLRSVISKHLQSSCSRAHEV